MRKLYIFYNPATDEVAFFNCRKVKAAMRRLQRTLKSGKLRGAYEDFECSDYDAGLDMLGCYR